MLIHVYEYSVSKEDSRRKMGPFEIEFGKDRQNLFCALNFHMRHKESVNHMPKSIFLFISLHSVHFSFMFYFEINQFLVVLLFFFMATVCLPILFINVTNVSRTMILSGFKYMQTYTRVNL